MAKRIWTEAQTKAIYTRDKTLLVSAAAGSGKTATLTERIIKSILDEQNPQDIRRMLIVTFTNAAVGELRQRIGEAIKSACLERAGDPRLEEQLLAIKDARIQTIDFFCSYIVKQFPERVGLPPNFRIAEEAECQLLASEIMDSLIFSAYEGELSCVCSGEEFAYIAECLTSAREEKELAEVLKLIYESFESLSEGISRLGVLVEKLAPGEGGSGSKYISLIIDTVKGALEEYLSLYRIRQGLLGGSTVEAKGFDIFCEDAALMENCLSAEGYTALRELIISAKFTRLPGGKGDRGEDYRRLSEIRKMLKEDIEGFADRYFAYSEAEFEALCENLYKTLGGVYRFLLEFDRLYTAQKQKRGICNYADLEKYALRILTDSDGSPSEIAKEIREGFDQIYIDEYQDVNLLQAKIFDSVSKPNNRFMVGDIKQSIYGFRAARPEIFADMKSRFPELDSAADSPAAALFMSSNFRCDEAIIDFVNGIFDKEFSTFAKSISYSEGDRLSFAKIYEGLDMPSGAIPEIHLLPGKDRFRGGADTEGGEEESESIDAPFAVAKKIDEILSSALSNQGKPYTPSDIAIILRSNQGKAEKYAEALKSFGIKASIPGEGDFFLNEEILLALAMLCSIDNPRKDIYLSAIMRSPIFGFTADELTLIRLESGADCLWEALVEYCRTHEDFAKGITFVSRLKKYRELSESMGADKLLALIYKETSMLTLASGKGRDNLILLLNYAKKHEENSEGGLYSFISYLNAVIESGRKFSTPDKDSSADDAVKIITAHKSKGLEFPVCIFASAEGRIKKTNKGRISLDTDFGISMLLKDPSGLAAVENPIFNLIEDYKSAKEFEEELRVLYVILTRARERLFIYGTATSSNCEKYIERIDALKDLRTPYFARKRRSMLEILLSSAASGRVCIEDGACGGADIAADTDGACEVDTTCARGASPAEAEEEKADADSLREQRTEGEGKPLNHTDCKEALLSRFTYKYPYPYQQILPEKLSVSALYPTVLDGAEAEELRLGAEEEEKNARPIIPDFISGRAADESAKRGIATHMFLQFCDLERLSSEGAEAELQRLTELEFLSKKDGARVRLPEIEAFEKSPLFREMRGAEKIWRELRFNVRLPAEKFTGIEEAKEALGEDKILVQGVIDCLILGSDGSLHLVDYKTDRLTKEELANPSLGEARLRETHKLQLSYYREAIFTMFGKYPERIGVYSLHLGYEIEL